VSCFCQICSKLVIRPATNLSTTNNVCPVTTSTFNKPVVGKQIENVSKEKNRMKWTHPASHSIIAVGNIKSQMRDYSIYSMIKCKSRCFIFKKYFQIPIGNLLACAIAIFLSFINLIGLRRVHTSSFLVAIGRNITNR
jgi:hypothetical protein